MQPKRRIHRFNFNQPFMQSGAKTHVALVDKAANLTEVLVMKAKEVSTTDVSEVRTYDDSDGTFERLTVTKDTRDYGGEFVYITESLVHVVDKIVKVR